MPRQLRKTKPYICVFCEGESEQMYIDYLKNTFSDVAVIKRPNATGVFEVAENLFQKNKKYRDTAEVTDEIWFFFDVEKSDISKWESRLKIIQKLRKLKKKPGIRIRLLMTTACIEYWLLLHYKNCSPHIETVAEKENILREVRGFEPNYKKGDRESTFRIAKRYPIAVKNAEQSVRRLVDQGLPGLDDTDERNQWLYKNCLTFSTAYEAINYLESLK